MNHRATERSRSRTATAPQYPAGSMGPKVEAACRFVERTGGTAAIGSVDEVEEILDGRAGTQVSATGPTLERYGRRRARVA